MGEQLMQLSRRIPARTKTVRFHWCRLEFMEMSQVYRDVRPKSKPMDTCFWCAHKFVDGEMMALACAERGGNKVLCRSCAEELQASISTEQEPKE